MYKATSKKDKGLSVQTELFDTSLPEGSFNILLGLKQCMSRMMTACKKDRFLIAAEASRLSGREVSKDMIDKYVSSDPNYRPSADFLVAFCYITNSFEPFRYLLEPLGSDVLNPEDKDLIELARLQEQERIIQSQIMSIRQKRNLK